MKKLVLILVVVLLASMVAMAQEEKAQVFGGYQFASLGGGGMDRVNIAKGWDADLAFKATKNFGIVADFSGGYKDGGKLHTFMFGPRFSGNVGKVTPFAEALFGAAHGSGFGDSATDFAFGFGGGLDAHINKKVAFRVAKLDYVVIRESGVNLNAVRLATGIVFKF